MVKWPVAWAKPVPNLNKVIPLEERQQAHVDVDVVVF
jgi:hypothetical protein